MLMAKNVSQTAACPSGLSAIISPVRLTITANADLLGLSYLLYYTTYATRYTILYVAHYS